MRAHDDEIGAALVRGLQNLSPGLPLDEKPFRPRMFLSCGGDRSIQRTLLAPRHLLGRPLDSLGIGSDRIRREPARVKHGDVGTQLHRQTQREVEGGVCGVAEIRRDENVPEDSHDRGLSNIGAAAAWNERCSQPENAGRNAMVHLVKRTDAQIQRQVLEELRWDTRVKETDIGVEVSAGVVTLTGAVDSWTARLAAQEAAHRVSGVLDVVNEVEVKLPGNGERTDADIAHAVRHALEWDVLVPHERIQTTVSQGVVTLHGKVDYWSQHDDAGRCVRNLAGVREVKNLIVVEPESPPASPEAVRSAIDGALARHAAHAAKHIQIAVANGRVILTGRVPSWAERNAVDGAVRGTPGVRKVDNQLRIEA